MPAIIGWLMAALETRIGSIVVQLLITLGISFTSYKFGVEELESWIRGLGSSMGAQAVGVLGFLGFDADITIILSAMAAKKATNGMQAVLTRKGSTT